MSETVVIDERFCGPAGSGNGGYSAALAARHVGGPAEVTLRKPPPLGTPLTVRIEGSAASLLDGETLIAEVRSAAVELEVPEPVSAAEAELAAERYPWRDNHPYPTCFVCGPAREPGDGLGIFPGPVAGRDLFAATWTPAPDLAPDGEEVAAEFVWAALDCPSGLVTDLFSDVGRVLLGRLAVDVRGPVHAGHRYVVQAWPISRDGRKLETASALVSESGEICAVAKALWIDVAPTGS
ncbi:MAG: hypothetical protein U0R71_11850 [Solirubrobacterales bacterium]